MPTPGTRDLPVGIVSPRDLERATRHIRRPSEGQASAGNYQKAHVIVGGLHVAIETSFDGIRRGVGPDGTPWSVRMPADYGYVKRTEGADGDHVDVYLGPSTHLYARVHSGMDPLDRPVWIVDQCDADSGKFDEHKCMLGFDNWPHARNVYLQAFSDGRGHERIGAASRLPFKDFIRWLKSGDTKNALTYRAAAKSASRNASTDCYGRDTCPCSNCRGTHGGHMTTIPVNEKSASDPRALGFIQKWMSKGMASLSATERTEMMQDAAVSAGVDIAKATELLDHGESPKVIPQVEDLWDGPPDDQLKTTPAHGPGSRVPGGSVGIAPPQRASGDGAEKMEGEYSRHVPQSGVQRATEMLGREVTGMRAAMKSFLGAFSAVNTQIELLKSGTALATDPVAMEAAVSKAIASLDIGSVVSKAVAAAVKAEREKEDRKKKKASELEAGETAKAESAAEEDDEAKLEEDGEAAKGDSIQAEIEDEDDDDKEGESAKSAAAMRLKAASRVKWANFRLRKAREFIAEGKPEAVALNLAKARFNIAKADAYLGESTAIRKSAPGPRSEQIAAALAKARKRLPEAEAENQTKFPNSEHAGETRKAVEVPGGVDLAKAMEQIKAAADGMGMMTATVGEFMNAMVSKGTGNMPPVFALAKANTTEIATRESELLKLRDDNVINYDEFDAAKGVMGRIRMGLPADLIEAQMNRLPEPAQKVLKRAA